MEQMMLKEVCSWIGVPADQYPESRIASEVQRAYFKTSFSAGKDAKLKAVVTAHSRYKLWVNGSYVTFGPCKADHFHQYCDELDLSGYLQEGENTILLQVMAYPPKECVQGDEKGPDWSVNKACGGCMLFSGKLVTEGRETDLSTGNYPWHCHFTQELTPHFYLLSQWMGAMEEVDGENCLTAEEWNTPALTDRWHPAQVKWSTEPSPYGILPVFDLYRRPIPFMTKLMRHFARQNPVKLTEGEREISFRSLKDQTEEVVIPAHTRAVMELDAGTHQTGMIRFPCRGGAGTKLKVTYAESYFLSDEKGELRKEIRDDYEHGFLYGHSDLYWMRDGEQVYEPFWFRTFRFIRVELETGDTPAAIQAPYYLETRYPLEEKTCLEQENEQWIRPIWEISLNTLRNCMHETYEDCPYYEQMQYTMDTRLQMLFVYALSGDTRIAKQTIYQYHTSLLPNGMLQSRYPCNDLQVIPAFALQWILMLEDYYEFTGDLELIERYRPTMEAVLGYYRRHKVNGLAEHLGYWEMIDWCKAWGDNYGCPTAGNTGPSSIQNFIYAYVLHAAARLVQAVRLPDLARRYEGEAKEIEALLYQRCYDPKRGLYREGPGIEDYSQHAQLFAVLCGVGDQAFRRGLMERVHQSSDLIPCSFPLQFYLFRAYEAVGMYDATQKLWDLWEQPLKWHMTTVPEEPADARSDCHAWGSLMLYEFPRKILGVDAEAPGYERIGVHPIAGYVKKAAGKVHTPAGEVQVSYEYQGESFWIEVSNLTGKPCTLYLPDGSQAEVAPGQTCEQRCGL